MPDVLLDGLRDTFDAVVASDSILPLPAASAAAARAKDAITKGEKIETSVHRQAMDVLQRLHDELAGVRLLYLERDERELYEAKQLFGPVVHERFPSAIRDIEQAGKNLALGRSTACVFHLMRVMEVGLASLAKDLGVTRWNPTWNAAILQIQSAISTRSTKQLTPKERRRNEYLESAAAYIRGVSFAWRNKTMHRVESNYSPEEAREVLDAVKMFMAFLAKHLRRPRGRRQ